MRKILCGLMAMLMCAMLAGCGSDETPEEEVVQATEAPVEEETVQIMPEPELAPTPEPEQIPLMDPSDITLESNVNRTLGISYQFPSNWETVYGKHTLCYVEPTTQGVRPARMAITCKAVNGKPSDAQMEEQMASFMEKLEQEFGDLITSDFKYGVSLMGEKGYRQSYTATIGAQEVTGYVVMVYKNGNIYMLHMSAETSRYVALADVWYNIRLAVLPLS